MQSKQRFKYVNFATHFAPDTKVSAKPYWKCDKCGKIFNGFNRLKIHKNESHAYALAILTASCISNTALFATNFFQ